MAIVTEEVCTGGARSLEGIIERLGTQYDLSLIDDLLCSRAIVESKIVRYIYVVIDEPDCHIRAGRHLDGTGTECTVKCL